MKTEAVREHFRAQVPDYPSLMRRLIPFYDEQRDLMLSLIPFERVAPLRVLDLGCGPVYSPTTFSEDSQTRRSHSSISPRR